MDARARAIAERLDGLLTWAALDEAGVPRTTAHRLLADLRKLHDGVFVTGHGRVTPHQRRLAATLTTTDSVLSHASAAAAWGFRPTDAPFEVVTRPGSGGPQRTGDLLVCRSTTLSGQVTRHDGITLTHAARTIVDLSAHLDSAQRAKAVREAIRVGAASALEIRIAAHVHRGRRGVAGLAALARRLEDLPIARTKSDAEARSLEILGAARMPAPRVNVHEAGEECDLSWPHAGLIVEVDGPQYHRDSAEDSRKSDAWRAAGLTVERLPSDLVFECPEQLVDLVVAGLAERRRSSPVRNSMNARAPERSNDAPPSATARNRHHTATASRATPPALRPPHPPLKSP